MMNAIAKKFPISCLTNKRPPQNLHGITLVHDPIAIGPWNMPHAFLYREDRRDQAEGAEDHPAIAIIDCPQHGEQDRQQTEKSQKVISGRPAAVLNKSGTHRPDP